MRKSYATIAVPSKPWLSYCCGRLVVEWSQGLAVEWNRVEYVSEFMGRDGVVKKRKIVDST